MTPRAYAIFTPDGHCRIWHTDPAPVAELAERESLPITELFEHPEWHPIDHAPRSQRVLVKAASGEIYAAHWVQDPFTGHEAWCVSEAPDGTQHLVQPVEWREI